MAEKDYVKTVYVDGSEPDVDAVHLNNTEDGLDGLYHPEFDDSGTVEGITSFPIFLSTVVKRMNPIAFYKNFKAGMKYVLHTGSLINNGLCTETGKYAADATQLNPNIANTLAWQVAKVNSDLDEYYSLNSPIKIIPQRANLNDYTAPGQYKTESAAISNTVTNTPYTASGFKLTVEYLSVTSHIMQTLKSVNASYAYFRTGDFSNGTWNWRTWISVLTNADILTKTVNLTQVTVPANSGTAGSTTNISAQIPAGYKLLDAREVGSGNNGCYVYFFNFDGVNITLQIRNITNAAITTTPVARLLLIPK